MGISSALGSSALLPAGWGFRNAIINGDFRVNQRAFSSTTTTGTYGFDRWVMLGVGGTTTYSAQTFTVGTTVENQQPQNYARLVTTGQSATNSLSILAQRIEGVRTFAGQQVTVSFWAKASSGTPKIAVEFAQVFGTSGSSDVNTYVSQVTLSTSWVRYTVTGSVPSISGKTIGTANDCLALNLWVSAGSDYNSRTGSIGIQSNTFDFWGVQVEANNVPTSFEQRPIGVELQLCQRYYQVWSNSSATAGMTIGTSWYSWPMIMSTPMRPGVRSTSFTIPGVLYGANIYIGSYSGSVAIYNAARPHHFTLYCLLSSTPNSYSSVWCTFNDHTVVIDCEL